jgi:hypothetical protein
MGSICGGQKKSKNYETDTGKDGKTLTMDKNNNVVGNKLNNGVKDESIKKTISINQGTFINEKLFGKFLQEYEIVEYIGSGNFSLNIL